MSKVEEKIEFLFNEAVKSAAERRVLRQVLTTLISRHARDAVDPEQFIKSLIDAPLAALDGRGPEDARSAKISENTEEFCKLIESDALSLVRGKAN